MPPKLIVSKVKLKRRLNSMSKAYIKKHQCKVDSNEFKNFSLSYIQFCYRLCWEVNSKYLVRRFLQSKFSIGLSYRPVNLDFSPLYLELLRTYFDDGRVRFWDDIIFSIYVNYYSGGVLNLDDKMRNSDLKDAIVLNERTGAFSSMIFQRRFREVRNFSFSDSGMDSLLSRRKVIVKKYSDRLTTYRKTLIKKPEQVEFLKKFVEYYLTEQYGLKSFKALEFSEVVIGRLFTI